LTRHQSVSKHNLAYVAEMISLGSTCPLQSVTGPRLFETLVTGLRRNAEPGLS
jgi:hypothetical protein